MDQTNLNQKESLQEENTNPIVVGLDIGTTKIAVFVAQKDKYGKLRILGMGRADSNGGVMRGEVVNIERTSTAIRKAVDEAEQKTNVDIKSVFVGIAGHHISSRQNPGILTLSSQDTEITMDHLFQMEEEMYRIALPPGESIIHVSPQEFKIDEIGGIIDPVGHCGSRIETNFHIITGKIAAAQLIKKCVERAGLQMVGLFLEPLASSASVLSDQELEAGVALVDIGGGTTDIAIFKENILRHTAVIPFAGNIITEDIKEGCRVLKNDAEKLKVQFGSALPDEIHDNQIISIPGISGREKREISMKTLSKIIHARMEEIFDQVYVEVKGSGYSNKLIAGLVVTGGGSQLKHLKQMVEYTTGFSTRIGFPTVHLAKDTAEEIKNPMYATGLGLILKGYEYIDRERAKRKNIPIAVEEKKEEVKTEVVVEKVETTEEQKKKKAPGGFKNIFDSALSWFEDKGVNKDFE